MTGLALALSSALAAMTPMTVQAQQVISVPVAPLSWTGSDITITSSGAISSTSAAVAALTAANSPGTLTNSGTIVGAGDAIYNAAARIGEVANDAGGLIQGINGINNAGGTIGTLGNNGGTINGLFANNSSAGISNGGSIGTLGNTNGGMISGRYGIYDAGVISTLNNSAGILGYTAIAVDHGAIGALTNDGTIKGYIDSSYLGSTGIAVLQGSISSLTNNSLINGYYNGISAFDGTISSLLNNAGATISGTYFDGIGNYGGTIGVLANHGLISGNIAVDNTLGTSTSAANNGRIGQLTNTGTIIGSSTGVYNNGTINALANSGTIFGGSNGFAVQNAGATGTLDNSGLISAGTAIYNAGGAIETLVNSGTIRGDYVGILNFGGSIGTVNNSRYIGGALALFNIGGTIAALGNSGTILGRDTFDSSRTGALTSADIIYSGGIVNQAVIGGLSNLGTISNTVTIDNTGSGTIVSGAIVNTGTITSLINSGLINNNGSISVNNGSAGSYISSAIVNTGVIATLTNASGGTISGINDYGANGPGGFLIHNQGSITVLDNAGLMSGATALYLDTGSTLGTLVNTGTIAGDIYSASNSNLVIAGGASGNLGTLTGYGGTMGSIMVASTNLVFASGNQLLNDNIVVNAGNGTVTNNGVLQVNNVLGVTGNYYQAAGSSLILGVTNPVFNGDLTDAGYGRLVVSGDAVLASGSKVSLKTLGYAFAQGQRYVVLAAGGTLTASGVTYSATGYSVTGTVQGDTASSGYTDLVLTLGGATGNSAVNNATNSNASSSLRGLFNYTGTDSSLLNVFNPAAALDTPGSANKAGDQMSPGAVRGAANQAVGMSNQATNDIANDRMDGMRVANSSGNGSNGSSGVATGESMRDIALWGQVFGGRATQGERDSVAGYHANFRGSLIGADGLVSDSLRIGGLFSVSKTSVASEGNNTGSSANINNYGVTAYATYDGAPWYINVQAGVARQRFSTVRNISYTGFSGTAYGDFNGTQYLTSVQAGYPLNLETWLPGATLTPMLGLSYSNLRENGYTESGGNGAALSVNASSSSSLKSELGAKLAISLDSAYGKWLPSVQAGWRHEYRDGATQTGASFAADSTGATAFVAQGAKPVANVGVLNLGVTLLRSANLSLTGKYTLEKGGGYTAHTGSVQVRWQY